MSLATGLPLFDVGLPTAPPRIVETRSSLDVLQDDHAIPAILREFDSGRKSTVLAMATGTGKAQPLDAKVLTPTGWRLMGELAVGDLVISRNGEATRVTGVFDQGVKQIVRVTMSDGSFTECCEDHLWLVRDRHRQKRRIPFAGQTAVWPTDYLRENILSRDGRPRWSIPLVEPVRFPKRELPIHPYVMGVLLGDGSFRNGVVRLSCKDPEIVSIVGQLLPDGVALKKVAGDNVDFVVSSGKGRKNSVLEAVRSFGLAEKYSHEKSVPDDYLFSDEHDRWLLLQGLLDTDGDTDAHCVSYSTTSPHLAEAMRFLVNSLGGTVSVARRVTRYTHLGQQKEGRLSYRVTVKLPGWVPPFQLPRKAAVYTPKTKYQPRRAIVSIEPVGEKPCRCISVEDRSRLYVTDDFIVTHNTVVSAKLVKILSDRGRKILFVVDERRLAKQAVDKFRAWGVTVGLEMAEESVTEKVAGHLQCLVTTRQTFASRLKRWGGRFDTIIIDEAHCGIAGKQLKKIIETFPDAWLLLLSATPYLANGKMLSPHFAQTTAFEYPMPDYPDGRPGAVSSGHLVPPVLVECQAGVDLRGLKMSKTTGGMDYDAGELEERLTKKLDVLANAARMILEKEGFRRALCPTPDVLSGIAAAQAFRAIGFTAEAIYGEHPDPDGVFDRYEQGRTQVLCGCNMFVKGFDDQPTDALIWMRPTRSFGLANQILGRGLRLSPATKKTRCLVIGYAWVTEDKKRPVSVLDIFCQGLPDPRVAELAAQKYRQKSKGQRKVDLMGLMLEAKAAKAKEDIDKAERERRAREGWTARVGKRDVKFKKRTVTPFKFDANAPLQKIEPVRFGEPATPGQLVRLAEIGATNMQGMPSKAAEDLLRKWEGRKEAGLSSYKQWLQLRRMDPSLRESSVLEMRFGEAGQLLDRMRQAAHGS